MPSFPYVKKGDAFQPNLELDNAVRRMVNAQNGFVAGKFSSKSSYGRISVCNTTSEVIEAGTAVSFPATADTTDGVVPCEKAKSATAQFGVITSDIAPDSIGSCVVSGPVTVEISGTGDFAAPAEGGKMVAGASGAPILFRFENTAVINLGGGSGAAVDEYNGLFKLVALSQIQLKIISGSEPDNVDFCGGSDVPGFSRIPQMTMELAQNIRHKIYIYFDYDKGQKKYTVHLGTSIPNGIVLYKYLGEFYNGAVVQSYKENSYLKFADIWYLTPEESA
jgi:hypothetical protein